MQACFRSLLKLPQVLRYPLQNVNLARNLSCTSSLKGIEEFFPPGVYDGENLVEENPVVGRRWMKSELRNKSNTDLHKLWYILLKERNMLKTLGHECKRLGIPVPGPGRYDKVKKSMINIKFVISERDQAVLDMEKERWYKFDEQLEAEKEAPYLIKNFESETENSQTDKTAEGEISETEIEERIATARV